MTIFYDFVHNFAFWASGIRIQKTFFEMLVPDPYKINSNRQAWVSSGELKSEEVTWQYRIFLQESQPWSIGEVVAHSCT
jgi:hypothetical protein